MCKDTEPYLAFYIVNLHLLLLFINQSNNRHNNTEKTGNKMECIYFFCAIS